LAIFEAFSPEREREKEYEYVGLPTINFQDEKERPGKGSSFSLPLSCGIRIGHACTLYVMCDT